MANDHSERNTWFLCRGKYMQVLSPTGDWVSLPKYGRRFESFAELLAYCREHFEFVLRSEVYPERPYAFRERNEWAPQWSTIFRRFLLAKGPDW